MDLLPLHRKHRLSFRCHLTWPILDLTCLSDMIVKLVITNMTNYQLPNSLIVSHTKLIFATNELTHVLMLPTSSSLELNVTSKNTIFPSCLTCMLLVMLVFLVLVSEKGGSTSMDLRAASA
jgi:hypothetical protein